MRLSFGDFVIDFDERRLVSNGHEIRLTPKAFDLLQLLIESRPKALSKHEIWRVGLADSADHRPDIIGDSNDAF